MTENRMRMFHRASEALLDMYYPFGFTFRQNLNDLKQINQLIQNLKETVSKIPPNYRGAKVKSPDYRGFLFLVIPAMEAGLPTLLRITRSSLSSLLSLIIPISSLLSTSQPLNHSFSIRCAIRITKSSFSIRICTPISITSLKF